MCSECHMIPCHPRCPNAEATKTVCCECNRELDEGEEYYERDFDMCYCRDCLEKMDIDELLEIVDAELLEAE